MLKQGLLTIAQSCTQAVKRQKMKGDLIRYGFIFYFLLTLLYNSDLKPQTLNYQDSIIRITKTKSFLISNPAPQYILEIRNDKTISFYNNLPENFTEHQSELIGDWIIDSTTFILESSDFTELYNTINKINFENIDKIEKPKSKNGIESVIVGGGSDNFIIELTNQKIEFSIGPNNEKYISESAKIIRNLIEELEGKYKPRK